MPVLEWQEEYKNLLESGKTSGEFVPMADGSERRNSPRFKLKTGYVWIKVEPRFEVMDVSVTGISLFSDFQFKPGNIITITMGKAFSVEANVLDCELVVSDEMFFENKYLVRGKFKDADIGMQFLVMIKEMDNLEVEFSAVVDQTQG